MPDFCLFYAPYPRKEAKKDAMKAWGQITEEQQQKAIDALPLHVKRWEMLDTEKNWIPLPASWLRGWRFEDEIELPQSKTVLAWWATEAGTIAMAAQVGVQTRPGEEFSELKQRIIAATRRVG